MSTEIVFHVRRDIPILTRVVLLVVALSRIVLSAEGMGAILATLAQSLSRIFARLELARQSIQTVPHATRMDAKLVRVDRFLTARRPVAKNVLTSTTLIVRAEAYQAAQLAVLDMFFTKALASQGIA